MFKLVIVVLLAVAYTEAQRPNSHYVQHTDACASQCQYYGQKCPILTFAPTQPGYDCNKGFCRLPGQDQCTVVPGHTVYAENTDACQSLCQYSDGCPIRPFAPTPSGFDCEQGYCRRTPNSRCMRAICYVYYKPTSNLCDRG